MKRIVLTSMASVLALASTPVWAQDAEDEDASAGDIIVTATRSETLLSKTPIAMTAISAEGMRDAGITDARSLNDFVPNLAISENGDAARISIRGVTSTDLTEKGDPSAAFLLDGVYIARPIEALNTFYDLERVEVLRGPQGTLYGRNTTAGVINVISARPKDEFEASIDGKYGNLSSTNLTGMINMPLGEGLGIRAALNYDRQNSPIIQTGPVTNSLNPFRNSLSGKLSLGGSLGDNFDFVIRGDYTHAKGGIYNSLPLSTFYPGALTPTVDPVYVSRSAKYLRTLNVPLGYPDRKNNKFYGIMGEFTYDLGSAALTYVGSYRKAKREDVRNFLLFGALNNPAYFFGDFNQNSHELRLAFGEDKPLHGQAGLYYFHEKSTLELNLGLPLSSFVVPGATGFAFPQGPTKATSKAAFGQLTYDLTEDLSLTAGVRYTKDNKSRVGQTVVDFPNLGSSICGQLRCALNSNIAFGHYKKTTWKIGLDYDSPIGLLYATVSSGYKAGGFNDGCLTSSGGIGCSLTETQLFYNPETLRSYEAGAKLKLIDNTLRLNISAFHYDYSGLQLSQIATVGGVPGTLTQNAGSAKVDGVEFEALITPSDNDNIDFSVNYTNARYSKFFPSTVIGGTVYSRDFHGLQLDHAPEFTASAGYTHSFELGNGGSLDASARIRFSSAYYMQDLNQLAQFRQPSFTKTNLSLTYKAPEDRFYVQAFVQNLENEITLAAASSGLAASGTIEEPRTYGIRAGFKF